MSTWADFDSFLANRCARCGKFATVRIIVATRKAFADWPTMAPPLTVDVKVPLCDDHRFSKARFSGKRLEWVIGSP
jgi:hypothetical protein